VADTDARGAWSQTVYEVDDASRYAAIGRWTHADGEDSWESDRTLRPLPRREYTKRSDYQALDVVNRHALTPAGWVHEQDNTKLVIDADGRMHALAHERGINSYTRIADYDFAAGREYCSKTSAYWADVRAEWQREFAAHARFTTSPEPNGEPRIEEFFKLAERVEKGGDGCGHRDSCGYRRVRQCRSCSGAIVDAMNKTLVIPAKAGTQRLHLGRERQGTGSRLSPG